MKKYEKPIMIVCDLVFEESLLVGSIKYTEEEADKNYDVLSKERGGEDEWGQLW